MTTTKEKDHLMITSKIPSEVKELTWKIKNFSTVISIALKEGLDELTFTFDAGDSIGLPTQWRVNFLQNVEDELNVYLSLVQYPKEEKYIYAYCRFEIAHPHFQFEELKEVPTAHDYLDSDLGRRRSLIPSLEELFKSNLLEDESLLIRMQFTLYNKLEVTSEQIEINSEATSTSCTSSFVLAGDLKKLLDSGERADIAFQMKNGPLISAHMLILKTRSPEFYAILESLMKKPDFSIITGIIHLYDLSYRAMKIILQFIYTGKMDVNEDQLVMEELLYASNHYNITLLKKFCDKMLA